MTMPAYLWGNMRIAKRQNQLAVNGQFMGFDEVSIQNLLDEKTEWHTD